MLHRTSPPIVPRADARPDHGEESLLEFGGPRSARGQAAPASHVAVLVVGQCFSVLRQAGWTLSLRIALLSSFRRAMSYPQEAQFLFHLGWRIIFLALMYCSGWLAGPYR